MVEQSYTHTAVLERWQVSEWGVTTVFQKQLNITADDGSDDQAMYVVERFLDEIYPSYMLITLRRADGLVVQ